MKAAIIISTAILFLLSSCDHKTPDVSAIKIDLTTERFEKKLFDTTAASFELYLQRLQNDDPAFTTTYLTRILGADPRWSADTTAAYVNDFIKAFRTVYNDAEKKIGSFSKYEDEIKYALQLVKYYFPGYKTPGKIITYIGPPDGYGAIISDEGILVGLHNYLGKDYPLYKTNMVSEIYPEYISQRFEPEYITVNCIKTIVTDIYPGKTEDQPMVDQMIEKGKQLYMLNKFLPKTEEYKLIGYRAEQLKDCYVHEAAIWDFFIKNSLLRSTDKNLSKKYVDEGPKTDELGKNAPGNIGSFVGFQIVKKYMKLHSEITLQQLTNTDNETIFQEAKYKP